ncbi:MAG TPA: ribose 5-phosphate isomerase B [Bryobacteraceae bacterium]|nr:ribose 5-phosphate isomerase B [Bryobacteraceae bacterium]
MRISIAGDHAGFDLKKHLQDFLTAQGHQVQDLGAYDTNPSDYPDFAVALAQVILNGGCDKAILLCGSGVGASVAANKIPGIRAGLCHDTYSAHQGVEHDDMNMLVLGGRVIGTAMAEELVRAFLAAAYSHEERHVRRLAKIREIEQEYAH